MKAAAIGVVGTLLGVIAGHFLSERAAKNREKRNEEKQARSVRALVSIEIAQNLSLLKEFWEKISSKGEDEADATRQTRVRADSLLNTPIPPWSRAMWVSQASLLGTTFSEDEIKKIHEHHTGLEAIESIQKVLSGMDAVDRQVDIANQVSGVEGVGSGGRGGSYMVSFTFQQNAPDLWRRCESIVKSLLEMGNPI